MGKERKRLADTIRAEMDGSDLYDSLDSRRICVVAKDENGNHYLIGEVDKNLAFIDPEMFLKAINAIKYRNRTHIGRTDGDIVK